MKRYLGFAALALFALALTASPAWAEQFKPCTKCHFGAAETVSPDACLGCHSPRFPPPVPGAEEAHSKHAKLTPGHGAVPCDSCHNGRIAKELKDTKHPSAGEASAAGKRFEDCSSCHLSVVKDKDCMLCHANNMPHMPGRVDCSACHGALPSLTAPPVEAKHLMSVSAKSHGKLGAGVEACYVCHSREERDFLQLKDGTLLKFEEAIKLCGQSGCHPEPYDSWRAGAHLSDVKASCIDAGCHDPHEPEAVIEAIALSVPSPPPAPAVEPIVMLAGAGAVIVVVLVAAFFYFRTRPAVPEAGVLRVLVKLAKTSWVKIIPAVLGLIVVAMVAGYWFTTTSAAANTLCSGSYCHFMGPFYDTWREGKHTDFNCHVCHEAGFVGEYQIVFSEFLKTVTERPEKVETKAEIPWQTCAKAGCHPEFRSPLGGHERCIVCHTADIHAALP